MKYRTRIKYTPEQKRKYLVGDTVSYVDLSLFQLIAGLRYAFPNTMTSIEKKYPNLNVLHDHIKILPRIAAYLSSERRIPFNQQGIFRHYKVLDL